MGNKWLWEAVMDLELGKTGGGCLGESCLRLQAAGAQLTYVVKEWMGIEEKL